MTVLSLALSALIILGALYTLFALGCVLAFFRAPGRDAAAPGGDAADPAVSVLKPLKGFDPSCTENLLSFCAQDYPCYEVLFGFRDADDPAIPLASKVADSCSEARLVIKHEGSGTNEKVLNLQALAENARYSMLAFSDSDMVVDRLYLQRIMTEFRSGEHTGIVTSLYKISHPTSLGSALESLSINVDFIPSVLVARRLEGVTFGLGASMLLSKEALGEIGGFASIADYLADDYQIGFRLWKKGYTNIISRYVIENRVGPMTLAGHVSHQLRWARTYRASRPMGFVGYGITHILTFAILLLCISPGPYSVGALASVLALRYGLAFTLYRKVIMTRKWLPSLFLLPVKDVLSFIIWVWSFAGSTVGWRSIRYRITSGGRMVRV